MQALEIPPFCFRPATDGDAALVFAIFAAGRSPELGLQAWSPEQREQFLRMQYRAQTQAYRNRYPQADYQLIEWEEQVIGRWLLAEQDAEFNLVDICLLPHFRGQGLGALLLSGLITYAEGRNLPVRLQVAMTNPALHLYLRLGFQVTEQSENSVYLNLLKCCGAVN